MGMRCKVKNTPETKKVLKKVLSKKRRQDAKKADDSFIGTRKEDNKRVSNYDL
jgi:hypothetical protein